MKLPPAFQSQNRRNDFCRTRRGQTEIRIFLIEIFPVAASMRTAARAVKSASGEKDQTGLRGKIITKTVRIGPKEKGLRRFSVPDLLVACCLLKPLTASEQCPNKTGLYHICELLSSLKPLSGWFLMVLQIVLKGTKERQR